MLYLAFSLITDITLTHSKQKEKKSKKKEKIGSNILYFLFK